jgi:outer membrane protein assembly factor BamA
MEIRKRFSDKVAITIGPTYQFYSLDSADEDNKARYITKTGLNGLDPATLYSNQSYFGGKFSLVVDTRDNKLMPRRGVNWNTYVRHLSGTNNASYTVTQLNSDFTFYLNFVPKKLQLVNRFGGGHNFGNFEFYQAQYLGSEDNLRGFRKYRFAGKSKVFNNTELRLVAAKFRTYLFPGSLGFLFFYDTGRVWSDTDPSDKWQSGYGGGFWIAPLNRLLITFTYAASKEDKLPLVSLGWKF